MLACNVGKPDKIVRIIIGVVILAAGFYLKSWWGLIGVVPILTGVFGRCGLYYPLKINTVKKEAN
jgi:hypothetical protein